MNKSIKKIKYIDFNYLNYRKIILKYKDIICDYRDVSKRDSFALIRHDVEFSILRAKKIAEIDKELKIISSFFFQVKSNIYNIFSNENIEIINYIKDLGHHIGLHTYISNINEYENSKLIDEINNQKNIINNTLKIDCDRFSYHRPPKWVLQNRSNKIAGMINVYGNNYFEFTDYPKDIKYYSDSKHNFLWGNPLEKSIYKKFQILLHPDEWSDKGLNTINNFRSLEREHINNLYKSLERESKVYIPPKIK